MNSPNNTQKIERVIFVYSTCIFLVNWVPYGQLWATEEETASLTRY